MAKSTKVTVEQSGGEIVIQPSVGEPLRFQVSAGVVEVPDAQLELFLTHVTGSSIAPAAPAKEK
jgi:hypothetical protein